MARASKAAAAAPEAGAEAAQGWTNGRYVYRLTRPIPVEGEEVKEITLREPTTLDVVEAGNPCSLDPATNPPTIRFDERKQAAMISRLANIPPSSVHRMSPKDFTAIGWIVADFFLPV